MKKLYRQIIAFILLLCVGWAPKLNAQELNCSVEVNSEQIQGSNKEVFTTLKQAIADYMNTNKWTDAQFYANEKIECRLYFTIKSYDDSNVMSGDLQIQSSRPVYNSSYTTTVFNFKDTNIEFMLTDDSGCSPSGASASFQRNPLITWLRIMKMVVIVNQNISISFSDVQIWEKLKSS